MLVLVIAKYCPPLLSPVNGAKSSDLRSIDTEVTFNCSAGYSLGGSKARLCQAGGNWNGFNTTCTGKSLLALSVVPLSTSGISFKR